MFRKGYGLFAGKTDGVVETRTEGAGQEFLVKVGFCASSVGGAETHAFRSGIIVPRFEVHQRVKDDTRKEPDDQSKRDTISELSA